MDSDEQRRTRTCAGSGSFDELLERVKQAVPEMLKLNGSTSPDFKLSYLTEREDRVAVYG